MTVSYFKSAFEFRSWLEIHHATAIELLAGFYKVSSDQKGIAYAEAVNQALCFGWIDGIGRRVDDDRYIVRFTPRKPGSIWSNVNIARVKELETQGLMQPAGIEAFQRRREDRSGVYSFENKPESFDEDFERDLRANEEAWDYFQFQTPSYRRTATHWVMTAKKLETRQRRLAQLIEDSSNNLKIKMLR